MEQLEIHSKAGNHPRVQCARLQARLTASEQSYLVRWVNVPGNRTLSWSVQPHKKSINLGIFKHPGGNAPGINPSAAATVEAPPTPQLDAEQASSQRASSTRNDASNASRKLQSLGLILLRWIGRCEAEEVATGSYDAPADQGGMYAIVFDNTFSKQISKTVTLMLMTYSTGSPPVISQYQHPLRNRLAAASSTSVNGRSSPTATPRSVGSTDSLRDTGSRSGACNDSGHQTLSLDPRGEGNRATQFAGILLKRRRKRHQGYARRFFSLDFTSSTLSYYHNKQSSALRGAIPLSLAAMAANAKTREISVDSGAEVWHLKAANADEFAAWREALERAASSGPSDPDAGAAETAAASTLASTGSGAPDHQDWSRIEALVGRVAGIRDAVRRLEGATKQQLSRETPASAGRPEHADASPPDTFLADYFQTKDRNRLWKRKPSAGNVASGLFRRHVSGQVKSPSLASAPLPAQPSPGASLEPANMHGHCRALLKDLDAVVADFAEVTVKNRQRRAVRPVSAVSRRSIDTVSSSEFFDAEGDGGGDSQLLRINDSDGGDDDDDDDDDDGDDDERGGESHDDDACDASTSSDGDAPQRLEGTPSEGKLQKTLLPVRPDSLAPLPFGAVRRRTNIPPATTMPPSLVGFLRKNVGKDLSTISMPVSANEPLSLLQRASEQLEYSALLDVAATRGDLSSTERLLYVTAFAVSSLANCRCRDRAIRKPYNPMLGETYELVREDRGFRLLAEKISHRPVRIACQAESFDWTFTQCSTPTQKFWGKLAELITDGTARVVLHGTGELFSWTNATCYLRNLIAGEKYVEPVGTMAVSNERTGEKAVATFKSKGMFSGRSEEVTVRAFGEDGRELSPGLAGKWTSSLWLTRDGADTSQTIWQADALVAEAPRHYGLTTFAASLNETTAVEAGRLPPTDSRLRPDQRAAERGDLDTAETVKKRLEEGQRARRRQEEERGREWEPRWFERVSVEGRLFESDRSDDDDDSEDDDDGDGRHRRHRRRRRSHHPRRGGAGPSTATNGSDAGDDAHLWRLKTGRSGYWDERQRGEWTDVVPLFDV